MMSRLAVALIVCTLANACSPGDGPPLSISNVVVPNSIMARSRVNGACFSSASHIARIYARLRCNNWRSHEAGSCKKEQAISRTSY